MYILWIYTISSKTNVSFSISKLYWSFVISELSKFLSDIVFTLVFSFVISIVLLDSDFSEIDLPLDLPLDLLLSLKSLVPPGYSKTLLNFDSFKYSNNFSLAEHLLFAQ